MTRSRLQIVLIFVSSLAVGSAAANDYVARKAAAVGQCDKIGAGEYQTGLLFNPDGYRSYYVRSQCVQQAAVEFRDESLCSQVRRRYSLFSSSWGISSTQCRKLVSQGISTDRAVLERLKQQYASGPMQLETFRVQRNGNGRDFDFIPVVKGNFAHGYRLTFEIVPNGRSPILLHSDGYYLDANSNLSIYVRQTEIRQRFPEFELNSRYQVRATVVLDVGMGGQGGYWSDEFIESMFPMSERSKSITVEGEF
jgi:hypothetical protein